MVNFQTTDKVMPTDADMGGVGDGDLFKSGKLGMLVTGIWMFAGFKDAGFNWDITRLSRALPKRQPTSSRTASSSTKTLPMRRLPTNGRNSSPPAKMQPRLTSTLAGNCQHCRTNRSSTAIFRRHHPPIARLSSIHSTIWSPHRDQGARVKCKTQSTNCSTR